MTQNRCPRRDLPEASLPLQIKATNWPPADEIDTCNDDLIVTITEVIAGHTILIEKSSDFAKKSFELNTKTHENCEKRMGPLPFFSPADAPEREERGPRHGGGGDDSEARVVAGASRWRRLCLPF